MDIDTLFKNANFNKETIYKMINEITKINLDDNALLEIINIEDIRDEDEYGGYRVDIKVRIDNIVEKFHIDIATGDPITPKEIVYKYHPLLEDYYLNLWAYNIETVLSEKIETILSRMELNGRMRNFYDVYLIYVHEWNNINLDIFNKALIKTFNKREFKGDPILNINILKNSDIIKKRWKQYQSKYYYANNIEFDDIINCIVLMLEQLEFEVV